VTRSGGPPLPFPPPSASTSESTSKTWTGPGPRPSKTRQDKTLDQDTNTPSSSPPPPAAFFSSGYLRLFLFSRLFLLTFLRYLSSSRRLGLGLLILLGSARFSHFDIAFPQPILSSIRPLDLFLFNPLQSNRPPGCAHFLDPDVSHLLLLSIASLFMTFRSRFE
jgi:hypothetical protein